MADTTTTDRDKDKKKKSVPTNSRKQGAQSPEGVYVCNRNILEL